MRLALKSWSAGGHIQKHLGCVKYYGEEMMCEGTVTVFHLLDPVPFIICM